MAEKMAAMFFMVVRSGACAPHQISESVRDGNPLRAARSRPIQASYLQERNPAPQPIKLNVKIITNLEMDEIERAESGVEAAKPFLKGYLRIRRAISIANSNACS